jgi:hypothetical protein
VAVPALASLGASDVSVLCDLALSRECDALERALHDEGTAPHEQAPIIPPSASTEGEGSGCGASFCGFYHDRDVFAWADRLAAGAQATPASRAVVRARHAIESAMRECGLLDTSVERAVRCEAWLNVLRHGDFLRLHDHAGALVSGVCWLHVPAAPAEEADGRAEAEGGSAPWWSGSFLAATQAPADRCQGERRIAYCVVRAREGWCALFPGSLHHAVLPVYLPEPREASGDEDEGQGTRISLSFNYLRDAHAEAKPGTDGGSSER